MRTGGQWIAFVSDTPPAYRSGLPAVRDYWKPFNDAVAKLPGIDATRAFILSEVFAAEGGFATDDQGAASGISPVTHKRIKDSKKFPELAGIDKPEDLTLEQRATIYKWFFDDTLASVGGSKALTDLDDRFTAATFADTLFQHGRGNGPIVLRQALNLTIKAMPAADRERLKLGEIPRPKLTIAVCYNAVAKLIDAGQAQQFRDHLAERRLNQFKPEDREKVRARIEHFKFPGMSQRPTTATTPT